MNYAYFSAEGRLLYIASRPSASLETGVIERGVARGTDPNSIYLDPVSLEVMERQPFAVEVAFNRLSAIPVGTTATLEAGQFVVEDGELHFEADVSEAISVYLDHPHFIARYFEVETGPEAE
ncbi:hypothetical protein [Sphingomonas sp. IC081]|uniref:hypothetical protein n=1 Tax=Sphingomonas sp. IC081 TaxID=304378 RepID=UPI00115B0159|nr:hypothetical protein [Sphingomonas sp. IC081]QDK32665.1 hypothetical protein DM450_07690 [Sphingomonas sp. IC081]